jgi:hypothetical protein
MEERENRLCAAQSGLLLGSKPVVFAIQCSKDLIPD